MQRKDALKFFKYAHDRFNVTPMPKDVLAVFWNQVQEKQDSLSILEKAIFVKLAEMHGKVLSINTSTPAGGTEVTDSFHKTFGVELDTRNWRCFYEPYTQGVPGIDMFKFVGSKD